MGLGDGVLSSGLGMFCRVSIIAIQRFPVLKLYLGLGYLFKGGLSVLLHGPLARARHSQLRTVEQVPKMEGSQAISSPSEVSTSLPFYSVGHTRTVGVVNTRRWRSFSATYLRLLYLCLVRFRNSYDSFIALRLDENRPGRQVKCCVPLSKSWFYTCAPRRMFEEGHLWDLWDSLKSKMWVCDHGRPWVTKVVEDRWVGSVGKGAHCQAVTCVPSLGPTWWRRTGSCWLSFNCELSSYLHIHAVARVPSPSEQSINIMGE